MVYLDNALPLKTVDCALRLISAAYSRLTKNEQVNK